MSKKPQENLQEENLQEENTESDTDVSSSSGSSDEATLAPEDVKKEPSDTPKNTSVKKEPSDTVDIECRFSVIRIDDVYYHSVDGIVSVKKEHAEKAKAMCA
jgi:hypothetical protein